jgi:excinuclease ABC subunit C
MPKGPIAHNLTDKLRTIPQKPGVYLFKDDKDRILYVGKAKELVNRIKSYFQKSSALDPRKSAMMKAVCNFEYIVTGNELEALVLEANFIKQYRPRFNVLLRDDKSYPYLKLTNETWPRLEVVRRIGQDGARYFGPYVPSGPMWNFLSFVRNHYHIRTCGYSLEKRIRPCIQYQIKKCAGPCAGHISHADYMNMIREVRLLLEGKNKGLLEELGRTMTKLSGEMRYEEAALIRDRIYAIRKISEVQKVVAPGLGDIDVWGRFRSGGTGVYKVLFIRNGIMTGSRHFLIGNLDGETDGYVMKNVIEQFYSRNVVPPREIFCSAEPDDLTVLTSWLGKKRGGSVRVLVPQRGLKRHLVAMAEENAGSLFQSEKAPERDGVLRELASFLRLKAVPEDIGTFDISNISGRESAGAFVYWAEGDFLKSRYRHIKMDAVEGPDDYAMMRETVMRTFKGTDKDCRKAAEDGGKTKCFKTPDLIVVDGGKAHLDAVVKTLQDNEIPFREIVAVAKDPDRVFLRDEPHSLLLEGGGASSLLLRRVRDEAHRFAVSYHKKLRAKKTLESPLEKIPGIAKKRRFALLRHFGSIEAIKNSSIEEIAALKGFNSKLASKVLESLGHQGRRVR